MFCNPWLSNHVDPPDGFCTYYTVVRARPRERKRSFAAFRTRGREEVYRAELAAALFLEPLSGRKSQHAADAAARRPPARGSAALPLARLRRATPRRASSLPPPGA